MSKSHPQLRKYLNEVENLKQLQKLPENSAASEETDANSFVQYSIESGSKGLSNRRKFLKDHGKKIDHLTQKKFLNSLTLLAGNIENYIGMAQVPVGLAGPISVNGTEANGEYLVPLATTEGALVASYNRGMKAAKLAGGVTSVCLSEGVQRAPYFKFINLKAVGQFISWVHDHIQDFHAVVAEHSKYAQLHDLKTLVEGNSVILTFEFGTGDAAGQNMVTICTQAICEYIISGCPVKPEQWYIESNYAGDKKATAVNFSNVRGKKVTAEIVLPKAIVEEVLKTTPAEMTRYAHASTYGVLQSGAIGAQGHVANGLTALFIATGQDVACIAESSVGVTRMELAGENGEDLYVSVTLPSLVVGTIGGGTHLPTQLECLNILDCAGKGNAIKFAEICGAVALAGEISIAAAMSAHHFTQAHQNLGRAKLK